LEHKETATILLAEDDPAPAKLLQWVLIRCGYFVIPALDGQAAWEIAASYTGAIDLLVMDCEMPRMTGPEMARRVSSIRPETRVLLASGRKHDPDDWNPTWTFLAKPFSPSAVVQRVWDLLDRNGRETPIAAASWGQIPSPSEPLRA
jgi:DNA-binding response OmpR family regulator